MGAFQEVGYNCSIAPGSFTFELISIGNRVHISEGCRFWAKHAPILICDDVTIGPSVTIMTGDHKFTTPGIKINSSRNVKSASDRLDLPVIIEEDVWIGANVIILKGVTIHRGAVVAAGSVVVKDVEQYSIVAGNPTTKIKDRFSAADLKNHISIMIESESTKI